MSAIKLILKIRKHLNKVLWNLRNILPENWQFILFQPPEGATRTEEYCIKNDHPFYKIRDKIEIERTLPDTPDKEVHWKFHKKLHYTYREIWVASIPELCVIGRFGHILTPNRLLLTDASYHLGSQNPFEHALFKEFVTVPKKERLDGTSTILTGPSTRGYFHWLTDSLPRLLLLEKAGYSLDKIDHFIIPKGELSAMGETLDLLGIDAKRRYEATARSIITASQMVLPSMPGHSGNPAPEVREFLRRHFLEPAKRVSKSFPKRFYISRKRTRRIKNEDKLLPVLEKYDIQTVSPEHLSFLEQVALFAGAELIVAPHGAALTNLVFSSPKTSVIELFSPNYVNICYWSISNLGNLRYSYILGEGKRPSSYKDLHQVRKDITAPVKTVERWLESWAIRDGNN